MELEIFRVIANYLRVENLLRDTHGVRVEEQMGIFMFMLSHNTNTDRLKKEFQNSGETSHRKIIEFFDIISALTHRFLKLPNVNQTHGGWITNQIISTHLIMLSCQRGITTTQMNCNQMKEAPYETKLLFRSMSTERATWSYMYEKGLGDILKELANVPMNITNKFNDMFPTSHFTKQQVKEKEKELKANYKIIKEARKSGVGWNDTLGMIIAEPKGWEKLIKVRSLKWRIHFI
uniref:Uncharacterized protein n=1 Tax=Setaria italica TaxID=4555 RepID=K3YXX2_SETIT